MRYKLNGNIKYKSEIDEMQERMYERIKVSTDFSETPGSRYIADGAYSGELFREQGLIPKLNKAIDNCKILIINFDDLYGYPIGFLEETFGGLVRKGYSSYVLLNVIQIECEEDEELVKEIINIIFEADKHKLVRRFR